MIQFKMCVCDFVKLLTHSPVKDTTPKPFWLTLTGMAIRVKCSPTTLGFVHLYLV